MLRPLSITPLLLMGALLAGPATAQAQTPVKFALDWALQGNHGVWSQALDKGYFAKEGLTVTMDRGFGSGDTVVKVGSGAYDIGFADISSIIPFLAQNPATKVTAFFIVFDESLAAVIAHKDGRIATPKDLEGKLLGAPDGEGSRLLFPAFAAAQKIDFGKVRWQSVTPQLRETMLAQKQVDAITGFVSTGVFNLKAAGIDPANLVVMRYNEYGVDLYGSALLSTTAYAEKNPKVIEGFIRATITGMRDLIADPKGGIASLKKRDLLLNEQLELDRWALVRDQVVLTPRVKAAGFSSVDPARMSAAVGTVAKAYNVEGKVTAADVWTDKYLPAAADRMP